MRFINLSAPFPAAMADGFFDSLYRGAKEYVSGIATDAVETAKQKAVKDATEKINETLGIETATPTATSQLTPQVIAQPPVQTTSVQTEVEAAAAAAKNSANAILQTQAEAWKSYFAGITAANCKTELDKLTPEKRTQAEAAAKALGITLPCSSVTVKAKTFLDKNKEVIAAAAIGAGSFYVSKSALGAAVASVATYFITKKLMA